jgi:hypothetical protein
MRAVCKPNKPRPMAIGTRYWLHNDSGGTGSCSPGRSDSSMPHRSSSRKS